MRFAGVVSSLNESFFCSETEHGLLTEFLILISNEIKKISFP